MPIVSAVVTAVLVVLTIEELVAVSLNFLVVTGVASVVVLMFAYRWLLRVMYGKL